jgi:hypothetical protein
MIEQARAGSWPAGVRFEVGRADGIASLRPSSRLDDHIDGILAAYLFRNVGDRDAVLAGLFDLLAEAGVWSFRSIGSLGPLGGCARPGPACAGL